MLHELTVRNLGLIEDMRISFRQGLHVLTGETGAGKSMIIDALTIVIGGRASQELIRYGCDSMYVEAVFDFPQTMRQWFLDFGIELSEDDELIVAREIKLQGKSTCRVNGRLVPVNVLKEMMAPMVDIHGQHEHQKLLNAKEHLAMIDNYGKAELERLLREVEGVYVEYRDQKKRYTRLLENEQDIAQRIEFLEYQLQELEQLNLQDGEEEELETQKRRLVNQEKITQNANQIIVSLTGDAGNGDSAQSLLYVAIQKLMELSKIDLAYQAYAEQLENALIPIEEVAREIATAIELESNEDTINHIESRLFQIQQLKRKYRMDTAQIVAYKKQISEELAQIKNRDHLLAELEKQLEQTRALYDTKAGELTRKRKDTAENMEASMRRELSQLSFPNVQFQIQFETLEEPRSNGQDQVRFLFSANSGEPLKPLEKIASGGELSRLMLAFKNLMAEADQTPTVIFDEVDTGVSGIAAQKIAEKLANISRNRQVFCITHLPQIAAIGDVHLYIEKFVENEKTKTQVKILAERDVIGELGRMISGQYVTDKTLASAHDLRQQANDFKNRHLSD